MKIKYVSFIDNEVVSLNKTHSLVLSTIEDISKSASEGFEFCYTLSQMFEKLKEGFSDSNLIVLLIDIANYVHAKSLLFKAMNLKCVKNKDIVAKITDGGNLAMLNENQIDAQSAVPSNSTVFITEDGLFSGFGIKSNSQRMIVLPIDSTRVDETMMKNVEDFICEDYDSYANKVIIQKKRETVDDEKSNDVSTQTVQMQPETKENITPAVPQTPEIKTTQEDKIVEKKEKIYESSDDVIAQVLTNITHSNIKVSFGIQSDNVEVYDYLSSKIVFRNNGLFNIVNITKSQEDGDEQKRKENLSDIAREAMINSNASVGMAVSDVYVDDDGREYIFSAMCDVKKTNVYKVYAIPGESHEDIIGCAIINMFDSLNKKVIEYNEKIERKAAEKAQKKPKKKSKSSVGKVVLVIILVVLLLAVAAVIYSNITQDKAVYEVIEKIKEFFTGLFSR